MGGDAAHGVPGHAACGAEDGGEQVSVVDAGEEASGGVVAVLVDVDVAVGHRLPAVHENAEQEDAAEDV